MSGCIGPLYTPAQPIADVTPPVKTLLMMTVSEEGYVWQWDMPLQVCQESYLDQLPCC